MFGCIVCGQLPWQYAHIDPPFEDAQKHDPEGMGLLCHKHHSEFDARPRLLSPEVVKASLKNPYNAQNEPWWEAGLAGNNVAMLVGGQTAMGKSVQIKVNNYTVIGVRG